MFNQNFVRNMQSMLVELSDGTLDANDIQFYTPDEEMTARIKIIIVDPFVSNPIPYDGQGINGRIGDNFCIASGDQPEGATLRYVTRGSERMTILAAAPGKIWITCAFYNAVNIPSQCWSYLSYGILTVAPTVLSECIESEAVQNIVNNRSFDIMMECGNDLNCLEIVSATLDVYPRQRNTRDHSYNFDEVELLPTPEDLLKAQAELLAQVGTTLGRRTVNDCISQIADVSITSFRNDRKLFLFKMSNEILREFTDHLKENFASLSKACLENNHTIQMIGNVMHITIPVVNFEGENIGPYTMSFALDFSGHPALHSNSSTFPSHHSNIHPDFIEGPIFSIPELPKMVAEYDIFAIYSIIVDRLNNPKFSITSKTQFLNILKKQKAVVSTPQAGTFIEAPTFIPWVEAEDTEEEPNFDNEEEPDVEDEEDLDEDLREILRTEPPRIQR